MHRHGFQRGHNGGALSFAISPTSVANDGPLSPLRFFSPFLIFFFSSFFWAGSFCLHIGQTLTTRRGTTFLLISREHLVASLSGTVSFDQLLLPSSFRYFCNAPYDPSFYDILAVQYVSGIVLQVSERTGPFPRCEYLLVDPPNCYS